MKNLKLTLAILLLTSGFGLTSCKKSTGNPDTAVPLEQQTWSQLREEFKGSYFNMREFARSADPVKKNGVVVKIQDCEEDNNFFVSNGYAQIYYGQMSCNKLDPVFLSHNRLGQQFKYISNTLTIGNLYKDNGQDGNIVFNIIAVDEARSKMTFTYTVGADTYEKSYIYSAKQTEIPARYQK